MFLYFNPNCSFKMNCCIFDVVNPYVAILEYNTVHVLLLACFCPYFCIQWCSQGGDLGGMPPQNCIYNHFAVKSNVLLDNHLITMIIYKVFLEKCKKLLEFLPWVKTRKIGITENYLFTTLGAYSKNLMFFSLYCS